MNRKYVIELSCEEHQRLEKFVSSGNTSVRSLTRAFILLKSDSSDEGANWKYREICATFNVTQVTVMNVRKRFVDEGLEALFLLHFGRFVPCG